MGTGNQIRPTPGKPLRFYNRKGQYIDLSTDQVLALELNQFQGWKCAAGSHNIHISFEGDIYQASMSCVVGSPDEHLPYHSRSPKKWGNIREGYTLPKEWITCTRHFCECGADLFIPKVNTVSDKTLLEIINENGCHQELTDDRSQKFHAVEKTCHTKFKKQISWDLSASCNYHCAYCSQHENTKQQAYSLCELKKITQQLEESFLKGEKATFIISGGEPTLQDSLKEWFTFLAQKGHHISCHSNGSQSFSYYQELMKYCDLNMSIHFEYANTPNTLALIDQLCQLRLDNPGTGYLEIKLMLVPTRLDEVTQFSKKIENIANYKKLKKYDGITLAIAPVTGYVHYPFKFTTPCLISEKYVEDTPIESYYNDLEKKSFGPV